MFSYVVAVEHFTAKHFTHSMLMDVINHQFFGRYLSLSNLSNDRESEAHKRDESNRDDDKKVTQCVRVNLSLKNIF